MFIQNKVLKSNFPQRHCLLENCLKVCIYITLYHNLKSLTQFPMKIIFDEKLHHCINIFCNSRKKSSTEAFEMFLWSFSYRHLSYAFSYRDILYKCTNIFKFSSSSLILIHRLFLIFFSVFAIRHLQNIKSLNKQTHTGIYTTKVYAYAQTNT